MNVLTEKQEKLLTQKGWGNEWSLCKLKVNDNETRYFFRLINIHIIPECMGSTVGEAVDKYIAHLPEKTI